MTAETAPAILEIDLGAIVANWRILSRRHPAGPVAAVVKADAYGLGAEPVAAALYAAGCRHFFVAYLDEALAIRAVVPDAVLAVLSGLIPGTEDIYAAFGLTPTLGSLDEIRRWGGYWDKPRVRQECPVPVSWPGLARPPTPSGSESQKVVGDRAKPDHDTGGEAAPGMPNPSVRASSPPPPDPGHHPAQGAILHIDTGMARLGLDAHELAILAREPDRLDSIAIRYIMTHLVSAEIPADGLNRLQRDRFAAARAMLPPAPASLANSSGIFLGPDFRSDLARAGAALYGVNPTPDRPNPMRSVVRLSVRVLAVRDIPAGTPVGYNATWIAGRPTRIATAALGYADGFHRSLSSRGAAYFDGTPVPLVGRVSMDLTTFDVTDHPAVQPGCWLEVLGPHVSPDDVAAAAGTNGYEVLTSLGRRFHRVYRTA